MLLSAGVLAAGSVAPAGARAQTDTNVVGGGSPSDGPARDSSDHSQSRDDEARLLFNRGIGLAKKGAWMEALQHFQSSEQLRAHAVTTYDIAYCERALGRYTLAAKTFARAIAEHEARGSRELSDDMLAVTRRYQAELDGKIARVLVTVPTTAALSVDGRPLEVVAGAPSTLVAGTRDPGEPERVPTASFELRVDPGPHVFVVSVPGRARTALSRVIGERSDPPPSIALESESPPLVATPLPSSVGAVPPPPTSRPGRDGQAKPPLRAPFYAAFVVGAAGVATGTVAWLVAYKAANDLDGVCPDGICTGDDAKTLSRANAAADVATVSFVVGGVGLATAGVLWWLNYADSKPAGSSGASLRPWLGLGAAGISGRF